MHHNFIEKINLANKILNIHFFTHYSSFKFLHYGCLQACHACTAVIHTYHSDENVKQYTDDLDRMHKVVLEVRKIMSTINSCLASLWICSHCLFDENWTKMID